jgi:hypothetical protein
VILRFLDEVDGTTDKLFGKDGKLTVVSLVPIDKLYERYNSPRKAEEDFSEQSRNRENKYRKRVITPSTNVWHQSPVCEGAGH